MEVEVEVEVDCSTGSELSVSGRFQVYMNWLRADSSRYTRLVSTFRRTQLGSSCGTGPSSMMGTNANRPLFSEPGNILFAVQHTG
jgi:hypothetical protein